MTSQFYDMASNTNLFADLLSQYNDVQGAMDGAKDLSILPNIRDAYAMVALDRLVKLAVAFDKVQETLDTEFTQYYQSILSTLSRSSNSLDAPKKATVMPPDHAVVVASADTPLPSPEPVLLSNLASYRESPSPARQEQEEESVIGSESSGEEREMVDFLAQLRE